MNNYIQVNGSSFFLLFFYSFLMWSYCNLPRLIHFLSSFFPVFVPASCSLFAVFPCVKIRIERVKNKNLSILADRHWMKSLTTGRREVNGRLMTYITWNKTALWSSAQKSSKSEVIKGWVHRKGPDPECDLLKTQNRVPRSGVVTCTLLGPHC